jgi:transposase
MKKKWKKIEEIVSNFWYKKFLKQVWEAKVEIDEGKVKQAENWDWLHWIITNDYELETKDIWLYYRWLWQVEESFRINKHDLLIRPIFHWTEQKIKAHIAIAFMAFSLVRHLEYRLKLHWYSYSPQVTREALLRVQWSIIFEKTNPKKKWFLPSKISTIAQSIYKVMWKKWIKIVQDII